MIEKAAIEAAGMTQEEFERSMKLKDQIQAQIRDEVSKIMHDHIDKKSAAPERVHSLINAALCRLTVSHYVGLFLGTEETESLKMSYLRATADLFDAAAVIEVKRRQQRARRESMT